MLATDRRGAKEDADEVLSLLLEAGLKPIADTFSVLAKAYAKAGDIGGGLDVIELQRRYGGAALHM
jgi:pentatricopeptide repeat protein